MGLTRYRRSAFTPDALATFDHTMDEVWTELLADGLPSPSNFDAGETRARVAQKLIAFASSGWSPIQIKQLILRTLATNVRPHGTKLDIAEAGGRIHESTPQPGGGRGHDGVTRRGDLPQAETLQKH